MQIIRNCICSFMKTDAHISEAFMVCQEYSPPDGFVPTMANPLLNCDYDEYNNQPEGPNRCIVPFLACGDLSGFDSDKTYPLQVIFSNLFVCHTTLPKSNYLCIGQLELLAFSL